MAKVPVYQSQVGASTPRALPEQSLGVAAMPGRAIQGVGEALGGVGGQILKLQEQRNLRVRNIKALNLSTEYSREVHDITNQVEQLEGSNAIGAFQAHQKALEDLGKKYEQGVDDPLVLEQFSAFKAQANESSLNRVASHESQQTKVATAKAIDNLVTTHVNLVTANPDAGQVEKSLAFINAEIDLHYSGEIGQAMKDKAALEVRGNYLYSLGEKDPAAALTYLEDLKESGKIDAQNYLNIKGRLDSRNDEVALDRFDQIAQQKGISSNRAIAILANPKKRAEVFPGISLKQANALTQIFEGRARYSDYLERQAKADAGEAEFAAALSAYQAGDITRGKKIVMGSLNMNSSQRSWLSQFDTQIQVEEISTRQGQIYNDIDNGIITTSQALSAAIKPLMNSGGKGVQAASQIKSYFSMRRADDAENYKLADNLYKNALKEKKIGFESKPTDFMVYLRDTCQAGNVHGGDIVKKAQDLIGYVEERSIFKGGDKIRSTYRKMEQEGAAGPNKRQPAAQKKAQPKQATQADLLKGYDQKDIDGAKAAIKRDYPHLEATPERIRKVLDASR